MESKTEMCSLTDDEIIAAIQNNDIAKADILFDRYYDLVLKYSLVFVKAFEEAEDVTQEIFTKAFKAMHGYRFHGKFKSWLLTIARRTLIDRHRKVGLKTFSIDAVDLEIKDEASVPGASCTDHELLRILPAKEKEILLLRFVEGLSYSEISSITGMSQGSLRNAVSRAIKRLQKDARDEL